jgi:hypothetical protein
MLILLPDFQYLHTTYINYHISDIKLTVMLKTVRLHLHYTAKLRMLASGSPIPVRDGTYIHTYIHTYNHACFTEG